MCEKGPEAHLLRLRLKGKANTIYLGPRQLRRERVALHQSIGPGVGANLASATRQHNSRSYYLPLSEPKAAPCVLDFH